MTRRVICSFTAGVLLLAILAPVAQAKGPQGPKPSPEPVVSVALTCDLEPVPDGGWPPIPAPHLDAMVTWSDIGNRANLSVIAGDYLDGERREWGGHWEQLKREHSGSREMHLDVWFEPGDQMWATATIGGRRGVLVIADAELGC